MKKILWAVPLANRITPVLGCVCILLGLITSSQVHSDITGPPTITTDKSDYIPGDAVGISGSGWAPGEPVALHIEESDDDLPWDASATPDAAGNFTNSDFIVQPHDIGVLFTLTATQGTANAIAQFTDVVGPGTALNGDTGGFEIDGNLLAT